MPGPAKTASARRAPSGRNATQPSPTDIKTVDDLALLSDKEKQALFEQLELRGATNLREQTEQLMLHFGFKQPSPTGEVAGPPAAKAVSPASESAPAATVSRDETVATAAMFDELKLMLEKLTAKSEVVDVQHNETSDKLTRLDQEVTALREDNRDLRARVRALEEARDESIAVKMTVQDLECRLASADTATDVAKEAAEQAQRAPDLLLRNLPDCNSQKDAEQLVQELFTTLELGTQATTVTFHSPKTYAAAASASSQGRPRTGTVVARLASVQEKKGIYPALHKLKDTKFHYTNVDDNLTRRQQQTKRERQPTYQRLKEEGKRPRWRGDKIYLGRNEYQPTTSDSKRPTSSPVSAAAPSFTHTTPISALSALAQA